MEVLNKCMELTKEITGNNRISPDSTLKDIAVDSLNVMKLIVAIENHYEVFLDDIDFLEIYKLTFEQFSRRIEDVVYSK